MPCGYPKTGAKHTDYGDIRRVNLSNVLSKKAELPGELGLLSQ